MDQEQRKSSFRPFSIFLDANFFFEVRNSTGEPSPVGAQRRRLAVLPFEGSWIRAPRASHAGGAAGEGETPVFQTLGSARRNSQALPPLTVASDEPAPANAAPKKPQKSRIVNPGMFFRLDEHLREDEVEMVMVMAPEHVTKRGGGKDDMRCICAVICPAVGVQGAYEL